MKLSVITACLFLDRQPIHWLDDSCKRFGIDLRPYGIGESWTSWPNVKVTRMLECFKREKADGYTHTLYTDGRDSFFVRPLKVAIDAYEGMGKPSCLMATEPANYPRPELTDLFPDPGHKFRYLGAGQFIGELDYLIWAWEMLQRDYPDGGTEPNNESGWMCHAFVTGKFGEGFKLDTDCQIFQSAGNEDCLVGKDVFVSSDGLFNRITDSYPCIVHFNGGYSHPETGKEPAIRPVWEALFG